MATYAKILKDTGGNQILPYTRSKLVYMNDGSTVEDAVTRPATNAQMGRVLIGNNLGYDGKGTISLSKFGVCNALGYTPVKPDDYADNNTYGVVKVGSNILEEDGVISIDDRCIKEALGYTPSKNESISQKFTFEDVKNSNGRFNTGSLIDFRCKSSYYNSISGEIQATLIQSKTWFLWIRAIFNKNIASNTTPLLFSIMHMHPDNMMFSSGSGLQYNSIFPIINVTALTERRDDPYCGYMALTSMSGGHILSAEYRLYRAIAQNDITFTNFYFYDSTNVK